MNYRLAILTHGDQPTLRRCLESFQEHVSPGPSEAVILYDGPSPNVRSFTALAPQTFLHTGKQRGFCGATRALWEASSRYGPALVFWLEHDFVFERDVDLRDLATILAENPQLAQVSLMRDAVSPAEIEAGGLYGLRPDAYTHRLQSVEDLDPSRTFEWMEHQAYFTTNPSLMLRGFMEENPWPDYPAQCEGRFGLDLIARGFNFGVMGRGEAWVSHVGVRTGKGY